MSTIHPDDLTAMTASYIGAALWTGLDWTGVGDSDRNPIELDAHYCASDLTPEANEAARRTCEAFANEQMPTLERIFGPGVIDWPQVGHDLILTRNCHGAGFWDRGYGDDGETLTEAAQTLGEDDLYPDDSGNLHWERED